MQNRIKESPQKPSGGDIVKGEKRFTGTKIQSRLIQNTVQNSYIYSMTTRGVGKLKQM